MGKVAKTLIYSHTQIAKEDFTSYENKYKVKLKNCINTLYASWRRPAPD